MTPRHRPTRKQHLEQCERLSELLVEFVRETHATYAAGVAEWEPAPMPEDWQ